MPFIKEIGKQYRYVKKTPSRIYLELKEKDNLIKWTKI